ncbi:MAG: hypothetical protein ABI921_03740, partial [Panacibacter sp.]
MNIKSTLLLFFVSVYYVSFSQTAPPVEWQKPLGGTIDDFAYDSYYNADGSIMLCGSTFSQDGDVGLNHGNAEGWVVKLDASGNVIWKKTYGGTDYDILTSIKATSDNGYILAGYTASDDGDVSGNHSVDYTDGWIIKITNSGIIQWQKCIGGTDDDKFDVVQTTADGGYILAGYSFSADGDVGNNKGMGDGWVVKLDVAGTIQWQ